MKKIGIYIITNTINGKVYIGSSKNISNRLYYHKLKLRKNKHINKHLQSSYNKYGFEHFVYRILTRTSEGILRRAEQYYINRYSSDNPKFGYNKAVVISNFSDFKESQKIKVKNKIYFGCYNKKGILIKVFRHVQECYKFLGGRQTSLYEACANPFTKTCKGYYWLKLDVTKNKFLTKVKPKGRKGRHREVFQFTLEDKFIKGYDSAVSAAKNLGLSSFNITRCLSKNNIYKGFKWKYTKQ